MEVNNIDSKLVKPCRSTPPTLRNYKLSVFDEKVTDMHIPVILYYSVSLKDIQTNIFKQLEFSLSHILNDYYPYAGRYMPHASFIDCSDQGALFVEAKANIQLAQFLGLEWELKLNMLQEMLPRTNGEAFEIDGLLFGVKVTTFECGGVAVGLSLSHKVADAYNLSMFINNWATRNREILINHELELEKHSPSLSSAHTSQRRGLLDTHTEPMIEMKSAIRGFSFQGDAISKMREQVKDTRGHRPSKVQLVLALLWKALFSIDKANNSQAKTCIAFQAVNLRSRITSKQPHNICGNFVTFSQACIGHHEEASIDLQGFFNLLQESIEKIKSDCSKIETLGENECEILLKPVLEWNQMLMNNDVNVYTFSSWCRFPFYKTNFGWGEPVWISFGRQPVKGFVGLMDDKEGDGVEAWLFLDDERMAKLEQDFEIKAYATMM